MTLIRADVCSVCCLHSQMNKSPLQRDAHTFFCSALIDNEDAQRETSTLSKVALTCFDSGPDSSWEDCGNYLFTISANISDFVILSFGNTILLLLFETSFLYARPVFVTILVAYLSPIPEQPSTHKESLRSETFNPPFPPPFLQMDRLIWVAWRRRRRRWSAERYAFQKWIGWWKDGTVDGGRLEPLLFLRLSPTSFHNAWFPFHG